MTLLAITIFDSLTADPVSFAAAGAGVTQRSPSPRKTSKYEGRGALRDPADQILYQDPVHVCK